MSANVTADGVVRQLDRRPEPDENLTEANVTDPRLLTRFLLRLFRDVSTLKRRWSPARIDFRDVVSAGTAMAPTAVSLSHNFGAPVVYWIVRTTSLGAGSLKIAEELSTSTDNRLDLNLYITGTMTIRVEESG